MTHFFEIMLIGLILGADSFSAALAMGSKSFSRKEALRFAFLSGFGEAIAASFGIFAGSEIITKFSKIDHWIAFSLLTAVALHIAFEAFVEMKESHIAEVKKTNFHSFGKVLLVSLATSIDALGVGIGLGIKLQSTPQLIVPYISSIALWAFVLTIAGLNLAKIISKKLDNKFGPKILLASSLILFVLAFEMLKI